MYITCVEKEFAKFKCKCKCLRSFSGYYYLYTQSDTLLLADVFNNFQNMCIEICAFDPARFILAPELA